MEQKPIKRSKFIVQLSKDHHIALLFCWKIRQGIKKAVAAERIMRYVKQFWQQHMQAHFSEEEDLLFAPLGGDALVQKALDDHRSIRAQLKTLENATGDAALAQLAALADAVDAHVRFEERKLFPYIEQKLSPAQLEAIGHYLDAAPRAADDFADEFWTAGR